MRGVFMSEVPIYYAGAPCGVLNIEPDGLYLRFFARVTVPDGAGLLRLFALGGGMRVDLGIPAPDGGARTLKRSLPAKRCPRELIRGELVESDGWQAYSGCMCGMKIQDGLRRGSERAFLFDEVSAGKWLAYLPNLGLMERGGDLWIVERGAGT